MDVKRIMVIGSGTMGAGIAQVAAQAGFKVILRDVDEKFLARGLDTIRGSLERFIKKGTITKAQRDEAISNVRTTTALADAKDCDMVIEAITENMDLKLALFRELDGLIGLDVQLHVSEIFHREFGDPKFAPCPLLRQMVRAGQLGKKAGKGFFDYAK